MAGRGRRVTRASSAEPSIEDECAESEPITVELGLEDVRKIKETVDSFNTVLGSINNDCLDQAA